MPHHDLAGACLIQGDLPETLSDIAVGAMVRCPLRRRSVGGDGRYG